MDLLIVCSPMEMDLAMLTDPTLWPEHPYLRIERRTEPRRGQATCFLRANVSNEMEPFVFVSPTWPPDDEQDPMVVSTFEYGNLDSLTRQGWRIIR